MGKNSQQNIMKVNLFKVNIFFYFKLVVDFSVGQLLHNYNNKLILVQTFNKEMFFTTQ